jgi:hypothetical protein
MLRAACSAHARASQRHPAWRGARQDDRQETAYAYQGDNAQEAGSVSSGPSPSGPDGQRCLVTYTDPQKESDLRPGRLLLLRVSFEVIAPAHASALMLDGKKDSPVHWSLTDTC